MTKISTSGWISEIFSPAHMHISFQRKCYSWALRILSLKAIKYLQQATETYFFSWFLD